MFLKCNTWLINDNYTAHTCTVHVYLLCDAHIGLLILMSSLSTTYFSPLICCYKSVGLYDLKRYHKGIYRPYCLNMIFFFCFEGLSQF